MPGAIRKAVIRRIADQRRVSYAVASTIYGSWTIRQKERACFAEEKRQAKARRAAEPREQSMASLAIEASQDRAMGLPVEDWIAEGFHV